MDEFSLGMHSRPILRPQTESVSTIQGDPEEELVGCVEHDPPHEVQHVDVPQFRRYFLDLVQVVDGGLHTDGNHPHQPGARQS